MSRIEKALEKASQLRNMSNRAGGVRQPADQTGHGAAAKNIETSRSVDPHLIAINGHATEVSEEYKKLKTTIVNMMKREAGQNMLLITSSVGGEGKSLTAANLALSLSQDYDHSVLLIDADLRKPSLYRLFRVTPDTGLADCIADGNDIAAGLIALGNGNLSLLPSGRHNNSPVELFSSQKMQRTIAALKDQYADWYIIFDTPPVLLFAETKLLSMLVDGVILVVKEGRAPLQHITDALDALKGANVMGLVYNAVGPAGLHGRYTYHSYYVDYGK